LLHLRQARKNTPQGEAPLLRARKRLFFGRRRGCSSGEEKPLSGSRTKQFKKQIIMKNELNNNVSLNQRKNKYVNVLFALGLIVLSCLFYEMKNKEMCAFVIPLVFILYSLVVNRKAQRLKNAWPVLPVLVYLVVRGFENNLDWAYLHTWNFWSALLIITSMLLLGYFIGFFALRWKVIQKNYLLTILTIVSLALALLAGNVNSQFQFFAVGVIYFVAPYLAYYYITQKKYAAWIIILPFVLVCAFSVFVEESIQSHQFIVMSIMSAGMYCLIRLLPKPINWVLLAGYVVFLLYLAVMTAYNLIFFSELMYNYAP
jgi:hypothetical protein